MWSELSLVAVQRVGWRSAFEQEGVVHAFYHHHVVCTKSHIVHLGVLDQENRMGESTHPCGLPWMSRLSQRHFPLWSPVVNDC